PQDTLLEAWLSRGDRRMAQVIYSAWQHGAKFDAWQDEDHYDTWMAAFAENGLDPVFYTHRRRFLDEIFPWEHINIGVTKKFLTQDYTWSLDGKTRPDCRRQCYACGILPNFAELRRQNPGDVWKCPEVSRGRVNALVA
ncbi:MAG TPA: B12-binding domain-containing radical SAM protein, partial [Anaerolineaceae bacterium]|nr:B12-binding domain-containing radical SAM protein [Anaerolineaceae bacterium]